MPSAWSPRIEPRPMVDVGRTFPASGSLSHKVGFAAVPAGYVTLDESKECRDEDPPVFFDSKSLLCSLVTYQFDLKSTLGGLFSVRLCDRGGHATDLRASSCPSTTATPSDRPRSFIRAASPHRTDYLADDRIVTPSGSRSVLSRSR